MEQTSWGFLRGDPGGEARCGINVGSQLLTSGPSAHTWLKADFKGKPRPARTTKLLSWNGTLALSFVSACALEIQDYTVKLLELTFFFNFYHKVCRNRMVTLTYKLRVTCDSICYTLRISFLSFILGHLVSMISVIFAISEVIKCAYDYSLSGLHSLSLFGKPRTYFGGMFSSSYQLPFMINKETIFPKP